MKESHPTEDDMHAIWLWIITELLYRSDMSLEALNEIAYRHISLNEMRESPGQTITPTVY